MSIGSVVTVRVQTIRSFSADIAGPACGVNTEAPIGKEIVGLDPGVIFCAHGIFVYSALGACGHAVVEAWPSSGELIDSIGPTLPQACSDTRLVARTSTHGGMGRCAVAVKAQRGPNVRANVAKVSILRFGD